MWDRNRSKGKNQKQTLDVGKQSQLFRGTEKLYRWKGAKKIENISLRFVNVREARHENKTSYNHRNTIQ